MADGLKAENVDSSSICFRSDDWVSANPSRCEPNGGGGEIYQEYSNLTSLHLASESSGAI
eukprot:1188414-Prorocentrum_minimum.AAC.2